MAERLQGAFTALVTPFNKDGSVDHGALDALVDAQIAGGISGLVPCGTTGEAPTLSKDEHLAVVSRVVVRAGGRVPVVAGTGGNDTKQVIEAQRRAKDAGATHALVVTPYYNKPTQEGMFRHFTAVADAVDMPIILYNVPGRTGCDLKPETVVRLAQHPRIVGIKDATSDLDRVSVTTRGAGAGFTQLSGEDGTTCAFVLMGGDGVISVVSNVAPREMSDMVHAALAGDVARARALHDKLRDLCVALFWESNPIPVKAALALMGRIQETYRLPLCEMSAEPKKRLEPVLRAGGWL